MFIPIPRLSQRHTLADAESSSRIPPVFPCAVQMSLGQRTKNLRPADFSSTSAHAICAAIIRRWLCATGIRFFVIIVQARLPLVVVQGALFFPCPSVWLSAVTIRAFCRPSASSHSAMRLASIIVDFVCGKCAIKFSDAPNSHG